MARWNPTGNRLRREQRFDGFISYSRRSDAVLAVALQAGLHRFGKPWYRLRALRVFLDDATLSANSMLWDPIAVALDRSTYFVLLASTASAGSPWVAQELERFLAHHSEDGLLIVLTEGCIRWDRESADVDWTATTALPPVLRGRLHTEPRWVDLTWARSAARSIRDDPRLVDAVADVAATLHGRPKDEMFGEDVRQHRRTMRIARATIAVVTALAVGLAGLAFVARAARDQAERQRDIAVSRQLAAEARNALPGRLDVALLLGVQSRQIDENVDGRSVLLSALQRTPELIAYLDHQDGPVDAFAVSADGRAAAWSGRRGDITVWDAATRTTRSPQLQSAADVQALAFSPDGQRLAVGALDGHVELWDLRTGALLSTLPGGLDEVRSVAFSPDGRLLAAGGWQPDPLTADASSVLVWDAVGLHLLDHQPAGAGHNVQQLVFSPDGSALAAAAGEVVRWDTHTWSVTGQFVADGGEASGVAFSHDGALVAASGNNQRSSVVLADAHTWTPRGEPFLGHHNRVGALAFSADDSRLLSAGLGNELIEWEVGSRRSVKVLGGHEDDVLATGFLADGSVVSAGRDGAVVLWDPGRDTWGATALPTTSTETRTVAFLGPAQELLTATEGGRAEVWDAGTGTPVRVLAEGGDPYGHFSVGAAGGSTVVTADMSGNGVIYDATDGRAVRRFTAAGATDIGGVQLAPTQPLAIDASGKTVAVALGPALRVLDVDSGAELLDVAGVAGSVAVSPDGQRVAALLPNGVLRLWQRRGPTFATPPIDIATGGDPVSDSVLSFGPDGTTVALMTAGTAVHVVHLDDENRVDLLEGHVERPTVLAFRPDGRVLATGGVDGTVLLWDLPTGRALGTLRAGGTGVSGLAFSADGTRLASAVEAPVWQVGENGLLQRPPAVPSVLLWNLDLTSWSAEACRIAGRNLSIAEWTRYVGPELPYRSACPQFTAGG